MNRIIKKLVNDEWVDYQMKDLKEGDIFQMFEPNEVQAHAGEQVGDTWIAKSDAYLMDGVWGTIVEEYK